MLNVVRSVANVVSLRVQALVEGASLLALVVFGRCLCGMRGAGGDLAGCRGYFLSSGGTLIGGALVDDQKDVPFAL